MKSFFIVLKGVVIVLKRVVIVLKGVVYLLKIHMILDLQETRLLETQFSKTNFSF